MRWAVARTTFRRSFGAYPLRRYAASGQPVFAANLAQKDYAAIARSGGDLYAMVGSGGQARLERLVLPGDRARMANGAEAYSVFSVDEKASPITGLAVSGGRACVAAGSLGVVRVINLANGGKEADWPVAAVTDLAADEQGVVWAISGKEVVAFDATGQVRRHFPSGLENPQHLAVGAGRLAVVDRKAAQLAAKASAGKSMCSTRTACA